MNFSDTWSWLDMPVDEISRSKIEIVFSFGHNDGPASGLVKWKDEHWYVTRLKHQDDRFWVIRLTPEQQEYALNYGRTWGEFFHDGMSWNANGTRPNDGKLGKYSRYCGIHARSIENLSEGYVEFDKLFNRRPEPDKNAEVVGYFTGWVWDGYEDEDDQ